MRRPSKLEIFNDRHAGIVSFYRCVRDKKLCDQLVERLSLTVHSREEFTWCRDTWESYDLNDDVERAARWYYMQVYSFGGAGRQFGRELRSVTGTSFAGRIHACLPLFQDIHERFRHVQIECLDWRLILRDYGNGPAIVYLDPPYYGKNVYPHSMTKADHVELCQRIFDCSGFVALSGYDNEVYNAFPWDRKESWSAHVSVSGKAVNTDTSGYTELGSSNAVECLWIKERE
jgi:DNA adenine methylase